ncbi:RHS repeat domain-containing protein [Flavobacterium soli]|uniref:RHS repeat domain-containing protein n=1 Tax=Flavobacterium soli TaxID=344881 RepID=UPI00146A1BFD|nr:RHS repeat-associated core domain-containing protein [Flavobacterium soli]
MRTTGTATSVGGVGFRYTNVAEPTTGYHILTLNYYGTYDFTTLTEWVPSALPTNVLGQSVYYNRTVKPKGLATGGWVRVLERSNDYRCERSYMLYDRKARMVMSQKVNHLGGYTTALTQYDFEGKVLQTQTLHKRLASTPQELVVNDYYTYTDQGRLLEHRHKINGGAEELIAKNEYDALGQLKNKKVGGLASTATGLQKLDYTYNIRGWLKGINNTQSLAESGLPTDLFAFRIGYNDVEGISTPLYNGNIGETYWKTHPENVLRKYSYEYDDLNRLTDAYYQKPGLAPSQTYAYDEYLSYDKNGNILSMDRNGYLDSNVAPYLIDKLNYSYGLNSNRLDYVMDQSNSLDGFRDGQHADPSRPDYSYDLNGNMTQDWNKGISEITYNHLNLPTRIVFNYDVNRKIDYLYNALGAKLKKLVDDKTVTPNAYQETHYLDGFQYVGNDLQFFPTAEGYVSVRESIYNYVYNYVDHLGNIRLSYTREGSVTKVLEENHYYPFGMKHSYNAEIREWGLDRDTGEVYAIVEEVDRSNYQYKYQGQERQDELSLNWDSFKWRNYDYAIGRFMSLDPLAEDYSFQSPYTFCENKPIAYRELEGLEGVLAIFYHGGPTGGGQPTTVTDAGTTGDYFVNTQATAGQNGQDFAGTIIAPGWTSSSGVESGMDFFNANYQDGDSVIIYGYSYGVDVAVELTEALKAQNCNVELLVTVDGSDGPLMNSTVNTAIPSNVKKNVNVYQTEDSGASSSSRSTGSSSGATSSSSGSNSSGSSNKSKSGTSNSPGSNGGPNTAVNSKKTTVINNNVTAPGTNHANIQEKAKQIIQPELNRAAAN